MSRYTCHKCEGEHGTENMVAYCASCFSVEKKARQTAETEIKRLIVAVRDHITVRGDYLARAEEAERKLILYTKTIDAEKALLEGQVEALVKVTAQLEGCLVKAEARIKELESEERLCVDKRLEKAQAQLSSAKKLIEAKDAFFRKINLGRHGSMTTTEMSLKAWEALALRMEE